MDRRRAFGGDRRPGQDRHPRARRRRRSHGAGDRDRGGLPAIWEELSLAVTGLTLGQTARFARREGEGEAARDRHFEVRLIELKEPKLPELDAEFAGHFGKFADVAELETDIARRLSGAKRDEARRQREVALLDQLTERHTFPLPDGVVHQEVEDLLRDYAESN